jgi:hypothetical protein
MPRGKAHPPELRANAEGLLLAGHSQAEVCELTGLPKATVSGIASAIKSDGSGRFELVRTKKLDSDGDLIMGYFRAALRAMISQAEIAGDPTYCRTQNAHDLAIFHGVIGDKLAGIATTAQALGLIGPQAAELALPAPDHTAD